MPVKIKRNPLRRSVYVGYNGETDTYTLHPGALCFGQPRAAYGTNYQGALHTLTHDYDATRVCAEGILSCASVAEPDEYLYVFKVGSNAFTSSAVPDAPDMPKGVVESDEAVDRTIPGEGV